MLSEAQRAKCDLAGIVRISKASDAWDSKICLAETKTVEMKVRPRESNLDDVVQIREGTVGSD